MLAPKSSHTVLLQFYRIQLLQLPNDKYTTYTRWGRVGEKGQTKDYPKDLQTCIDVFQSKFKDKTGNRWEQRATARANPKKYTFLEIHYDDVVDDTGTGADEKPAEAEKYDAVPKASALMAETQRLLELIFNETYFQAVLNDIGYDSSKIPLGRLGKTTVTRGYQLLKELAEELDKEQPVTAVSSMCIQRMTQQLTPHFRHLKTCRTNTTHVFRTHSADRVAHYL